MEKKLNLDKLVNLKNVYVLTNNDETKELCFVEKTPRWTTYFDYKAYSFRTKKVLSDISCEEKEFEYRFKKDFNIPNEFKFSICNNILSQKKIMTVKELLDLQSKLNEYNKTVLSVITPKE